MQLTKKHVEAWKRLKKILKKVPRRQFNIDTWVATYEGEGTPWKGAKDFSCGTSGCAGGWATTDPWFRRRGLKFESVVKRGGQVDDYLFRDDKLAEIFGVPDTDPETDEPSPFFDFSLTTPKKFIKRIDKILEENTK